MNIDFANMSNDDYYEAATSIAHSLSLDTNTAYWVDDVLEYISCRLHTAIDEVYNKMYPFGVCSVCDTEFNDELINSYKITHCPYCGSQIGGSK